MHADTHTHQWKRTESPEIEPHIWSIDFHKRCKGNSMEKIQSYQQTGLEKMKTSMLKK